MDYLLGHLLIVFIHHCRVCSVLVLSVREKGELRGKRASEREGESEGERERKERAREEGESERERERERERAHRPSSVPLKIHQASFLDGLGV